MRPAVGHQELLRVRRHHRATRSPRLTRAKGTIARRRRPPRLAAPAPAPAPRLASQPRTRAQVRRRPRSLPRSNLPREFRTGSQKLPARTANGSTTGAGGSCKGSVSGAAPDRETLREEEISRKRRSHDTIRATGEARATASPETVSALTHSPPRHPHHTPQPRP